MSEEIRLQGEEVRHPPFIVNELNPVIPLSQTADWGLNKTSIPEIHSSGITGKNIKVAVVDTYCSPSHPDMVGAVIKNINVTPEATTVPMNGHGQGCAGVIGARHNTTGVLGVAPDCQIVAIKAMRESGGGSVSEIVKGIDAAIAEGCHIINLSLGTTSDVPSMKAAIKRAADAGIFVVCAAGNDGQVDSVNYPAKYESTLAIGATNASGNVSVFSSMGAEIDLGAPGERILTCWKNNGYATVSGTSFSAPFVAGVLALFLEAKMQVTHQRLYDTAIDIGEFGRDTSSGYGLINPTGYFTRFAVPEPSESPSSSASVSPSLSGSVSPSASESTSGSPSSSESPSESPSDSISVSASPSAPIPEPIEKVEEARVKAVEIVRLLEEFLSI